MHAQRERDREPDIEGLTPVAGAPTPQAPRVALTTALRAQRQVGPAPDPREADGVVDRVVAGLQRRAAHGATQAGHRGSSEATTIRRVEVAPTKKSTALDFDNMQYRVSGPVEDRLIELVERRERDDGTPYYVARGEVTDFVRKLPVIDYYDVEKDLGNWEPKVTHVNGMAVAPESGMKSAGALLDSVRATIQNAGGDVAVDPSTLDVLYTYSAQRSNFAADVLDCIRGKARVDDEVTESQEQLMLDAVQRKKRMHFSAHSRGTIKTDNAVRTTFKTLVARYKPAQLTDGKVLKDVPARAKQLVDTGLMDDAMAREIALDQLAAIAAEELAKKNMDLYIQLVYGGNAVSYPSSVLPVELFVGSTDFVSLGVGTYTKMGAKLASGNKKTKLHKQGGGHGYTENYASPVGHAIGTDIVEKGQ